MTSCVGALIGLSSHQVGQSVALAMLPLQYLIELGVLLEIAWHVLRPVHASLPPGTIKVFIALIVVAVAGGTLLASHVHPTGNKVYDIKAPMDLTVGLLRIAIFALTVGFAHVAGHWLERQGAATGHRVVLLQCRRFDCQPGRASQRWTEYP